MRLSFMTLGCPEWDLETICRNGELYEVDGIDLRGLQGEIDVTTLPDFTTELSTTARRFSSAGLSTSAISSGINLCNSEQAEVYLEEARRTIAVGIGLECTNIRVFGGGDPERDGVEKTIGPGVELMHRILDLPGADRFSWNLETHGAWVTANRCRPLLDAIHSEHVNVLWDIGHTWRAGREAAADTIEAYGRRIRYLHIKDAVHDGRAGNDGWRYVLPGEGELSLADGLRQVWNIGYDDWVTFEHEKRWYLDLEAPEIAIPAFVRWVRRVNTARAGAAVIGIA